MGDTPPNINIEDFYAHATEHDFARLHQFRVIEWKWFNKDVLPNEQWFLYLETATLPGREIANLSVPYLGMTFNVPGMAAYSGASNYPVTFRSDKNYVIRQMLEIQSRNTHDDTDTTGNYLVPGEDSYMVLGLLDKRQNIIMLYKLIGVHIINTGTIGYNLGDAGTIAKIDATLAYHYWVYQKEGGSMAYEDEYTDKEETWQYKEYNDRTKSFQAKAYDTGIKPTPAVITLSSESAQYMNQPSQQKLPEPTRLFEVENFNANVFSSPKTYDTALKITPAVASLSADSAQFMNQPPQQKLPEPTRLFEVENFNANVFSSPRSYNTSLRVTPAVAELSASSAQFMNQPPQQKLPEPTRLFNTEQFNRFNRNLIRSLGGNQ